MSETLMPLQKIQYTDVCSLYLYVNKYGKYPLGHPKIFTEHFEIVDRNHKPYEGLMKILILPPKKLFHPVLPYRCNGKLLFPLCKTCSKSKFQGECTHNDLERALNGTWVTLEIYKALDLGYSILKIIEVWHYEKIEQYDPINNPTGGLFTGYIDNFMSLKVVSGI